MAWHETKGGLKLLAQCNARWPFRDKASDGGVGDAAHQGRPGYGLDGKGSFHTPDPKGTVHARDVDENFGAGAAQGRTARKFADELAQYARSGLPGSNRIVHIVYENQVASGTPGRLSKLFWRFRGSGYGHTHHVHISFSRAAETDGSVWPLPCLAASKAQAKLWRANLDAALAKRKP